MTLSEIEEAAARWLLKRENTQWTAADQAELDRWLRASPSHRVSFMRLGSLWRKANQLKSLATEFPRGQVPPRNSLKPLLAVSGKAGDSSREAVTLRDSLACHPGKDLTGGTRLRPLSFRHTAIATSVLLLTAVGLYICFHTPTTYATAIGRLSTVRTHDGSTIELNTATEIKVTLTDTEREIDLVRGEAFFDVAKDSARPLIVYAGQRRITALSAQFSVRKKPDSVHVAVVAGSIRVVPAAAMSKTPLPRMDDPDSTDTPDSIDKPDSTDTPAGSTTLSASMVADIHGDQVTPGSARAADIERSLAWRHGYIALANASLSELVAEFNRYTTREIVIADPALQSVRIGGNFPVDNIEASLRSLEALGVHIEERDGRIVLTRAQASKPGA
jgi:transmembrane sensor